MLLDYFRPAACAAQTKALHRAADLHALSSIAIGREARRTEARVGDLRVIADAAEKRACARGVVEIAEAALRSMEHPTPQHTEDPS